MKNKILCFLLCICPLITKASDKDMNFHIQLLLADEVVAGKIYNMELKGSGEHWFEYHVMMHTKDGDRKLMFYDAQEPTFSLGTEDQLVLVVNLKDIDLPLIVDDPIHGVYNREKIKDTDIYSVIEEVRRTGNVFDKKTKICSRGFKEKIKSLAKSSMQKSIDYLFKNRPLSKEEFHCLVSSIKSKTKLSEPSFEPPFGNSWEGNYFPPFNTRGELIAYILPFLMDAPLGLASSDLSDKDRQKLTEAWLYWGAVKFDQDAKQK